MAARSAGGVRAQRAMVKPPWGLQFFPLAA